MNLEMQIVAALLLDALLGDPRWLPHPVKMIGWLAVRAEKISRNLFRSERVAGGITVLAILALAGFWGWGLIRLGGRVHPLVGDIVSILILYTCFAARDLIAHSGRVYQALRASDLDLARHRLGMIVGRDTELLDEAGIVRATVESVAENTVDGITAPLFWAVIGGPVGALLYKAVNTMDSMFGYKNEKYIRFGTAAARLDDLVNLIPARLTGLMMVAAAWICHLSVVNSWRVFRRDRLCHASPNSGHCEAATAGALRIQLGGTAKYSGRVVVKPGIGDFVFPPEADHVRQTNQLMVVTTVMMAVFLLTVLAGMRYILFNLS